MRMMGPSLRKCCRTTMNSNLTTYDTVPYPGHALAQAHPDRLATIATLFGMKPPDVRCSRVLELGCGDGLNLTSVALSLPQAQCLGIDLAVAGIELGKKRAQALGLRNIELRQLDLLDIDDRLGRFDFIIAHGIYSWVPEPVRDKLMAVCRRNLSENGVAYISYNTYPGGHMRDLVREMMRFHVGDFSDPRQRVTQARALIKFIIDSGSEPDVYRLVLQKELERINGFTDSSLFHDDLAEHSAPVYFYKFVEHAARHHLKYLCEAHFFEIQTGIYPPQVVDVLNRMADSVIAKEQYLDFLKCRRFRQTLLCHDEQTLDDNPRPEKAALFFVAAPLRPDKPNLSLQSRELTRFTGPRNSSLETDNPLIKAAMLALGEAWPKAIRFQELCETARRACHPTAADLTGASQQEDARTLGELLLRAYAGGIIEFSLAPPELVSSPGLKPLASPLARLQSTESSEVVNLRHFNIRVDDPLTRWLLAILDGSRDRDALLDALAASAEAAGILKEASPESVHDEMEIRRLRGTELDRHLTELAQMALLVA